MAEPLGYGSWTSPAQGPQYPNSIFPQSEDLFLLWRTTDTDGVDEMYASLHYWRVPYTLTLHVLLKKILLQRTRELVIREKCPFCNFCFWSFQNDFVSGLTSGELLVSPLVHSFSLLSFPSVFLLPFCFLFCPCCCGLLLASSMAQSSCCFRNCSRNSVCRFMLVTGLYPL